MVIFIDKKLARLYSILGCCERESGSGSCRRFLHIHVAHAEGEGKQSGSVSGIRVTVPREWIEEV